MFNHELESNLDEKRKVIKTDSYAMSIGEIVNMYKEKEIILRPEYQRYFRWKKEQKSKLIESILIGLPLPTFFMAQDADGRLEVVDGMQRLSTIFDFMGVLDEEHKKQDGYNEFNELADDLYYLERFSGKSWNDLTKRIQMDFKRGKIQLVIMLRETDADAKFELFQRLNSGGTSISGQELRNAILASESRKLLSWFEKLSNNKSFKNVSSLPTSMTASRYDMELVLRFIVFLSPYKNELRKFNSVQVFLTHVLREFIKENFETNRYEELFTKTFDEIHKAKKDKVFNSGQGKFSIGKFEAISLGIANNIDNLPSTEELKTKINNIDNETEFTSNIGSGVNAKTRTMKLANFGTRYFSSPNPQT